MTTRGPWNAGALGAALAAAAVLAGCVHAPAARPADPPAPQAATAAPAFREYEVHSAWLQDPELAIGFMRKSADLWLRAWDPVRGGYFTDVRRDGRPMGDLKTTLSQSRDAYGLARAYMVTGDRKYLEGARRAIAFLREHGWDGAHGGFYTAMNAKGESVDLTRDNPLSGEKWSFMQHYALLGIAAVYDAGRAPDDLAFLLRGREAIDDHLWDARPGLEGYYETADYDWSHPRGKGFTPTVDGITTHGLSLWLVTRDERARARLLSLADAIVQRLLPTLKDRLAFAEKYDSDWAVARDGSFFVGHVIKAAWCLNRAYMVEPRPEYREGAERLLQHAWKNLWDAQHGGPYYTGDWRRGALDGFEKNWWTLEQAITAGLTGYHVTGNPLYLRMADESADFFTKHLVDEEYGDAYESSDPSGEIVASKQKGHYWKAGYHTLETGWFVYLYGNLFLKHRPVKLHYLLDPTAEARTLPLDPIAMEAGTLIVQEVQLDGKPWAAFDGKARTLTVPAGVGGEFLVTFAAVRKAP